MKNKHWVSETKIMDCFALVLLIGAVYCYTHIGISMFQTFKDIYFFAGSCALMLGIMFFRRANLFRFSKIICGIAAVACILGYQVIHRNDWGPHYRYLLIAKHMMFVLFALAVWVFLEEKDWKKIRLKKDWYPFLFFAVILTTVIIDWKYIFYVIFPVVVLYATPMSSDMWKKYTTLLATATYCVFGFIMTLSLIVKPHEYDSGRYIGIFVFPAIAGVIASLALITGFWLWKTYSHLLSNKIRRVVVLIALMVYPLFALLYVFNRASVLSIFVTGILMLVVGSDRNRRAKARKRLIVLAVVSVVGIATWIVTIKVLQNTDLSGISSYLSEKNKSGDDQGLYILHRIIGTVTIDESRTGLFEPGTLMNALDTMSSTRVGIWYLGIKNIRFFGCSDLSVTLPNGDFAPHTHSTYLDFLLRFGIFGGGIMIIWFFSYIIKAAKRYTEYDDSVLFTLIWSFFCIFFFMV